MKLAEAPVAFVPSGDVNELQYYVGVAVYDIYYFIHPNRVDSRNSHENILSSE